jgi:hypothetical protein
VREGRARCERCRELSRFLPEGFGGAESVEEPPLLRLLAAHVPAGEEELRRPALSDDPREHRARTHVAAGEPDAGEEERHLRARGPEPQVRSHGDGRSRSDADAVDGGDDRLLAAPDREDEISGHAGESEEALHVHRDQGTDNLVDVAPRAEVLARAGNDHGIDIFGLAKVAERIAELGVGVEGEGILLVRPVEGHDRDRSFDLPSEVLRLKAGKLHQGLPVRCR